MTNNDDEFYDFGDEEEVEEAFSRMRDAENVKYPKNLRDGTRDEFKFQAHQMAKKDGCLKKVIKMVLLLIALIVLAILIGFLSQNF